MAMQKNSGLAFILGVVVVALAVAAWFAFSKTSEPDVRIELPGVGTIEVEDNTKN